MNVGEIKIAELTDNHLEHHGIKGQKWGIRRYQNEDGTLKHPKKEKKQKPESSTWKAKDAANLSDEELKRRNNRLQQEQQYRNMTKGKVRKWLDKLSEKLGEKSAEKIATSVILAVSVLLTSKNLSKVRDAGKSFISNGDWMKIDLSKLR